ncbi:MAG TPA: hypothetical protein PLV68_00670, partial [Ilumatobacteraceae bacterium]|nr:hypothetical protein [Ilumatobacteraceae bacterium]
MADTALMPAARQRLFALAASPVLASLVLAFVVSGAILALTGANPFSAYSEMWSGAFTGNGPRTLINRAIPIVGMALATSIPFRTGIIHIGAEGSMVVGGFTASVVALELHGPGAVVLWVSFLAGAAAG